MARRSGPERRDSRSSPGRLRIVAGKWRHRLLPIADVQGLRPTAERIRETLFNWLAPTIHGSRCLDLFAGTGAMGFEALSRGAASATLVETAGPAVAALRDSVAALQAEDASVVAADAFEYLRGDPGQRFDIVFLDPPFGDQRLGELCRLLHDGQWLADGASVYVEQGREHALPDLPDGWKVSREKTAGNVRYALLQASH